MAAITLGAVFIIAALSQGPVQIGFVSDSVARTLNTISPGIQAEIGPCFLVWDRGRGYLGFLVQDIVIRSAVTNRAIARFPEAGVNLSMPALLRGVVAPARLQVLNPSIDIQRNADGAMTIGPIGAAESASSPDSETDGIGIQALRDGLLAPVEGATPLTYLKTIAIKGATLRMRAADGTALSEGKFTLAFSKSPQGFSAEIDATLDQGAVFDHGAFHLQVAGDRVKQQLAVNGHFEHVVPSSFAALDPRLEALGGLELPLSGKVEGTASLEGTPQDARAELTAGTGILKLPTIWLEPKAVHHATLAVAFSGATRKLRIERAFVDFGGPKFDAKGAIDWAEPPSDPASSHRPSPAINLELTAQGLTVPDVVALWPPQAAPGGRTWVAANMDRGTITSVKGKIALGLGALDLPNPPDGSIGLDFGFQGLRTKFLGELPPLDGADGTAHLTANSLEVLVGRGAVGALAASEGRILLSGFEKPTSFGEVTVTLSGPMTETLRVLNYKPLGYPARFGIDAAVVGGKQTTRIGVKLPLLETVTMDQVSLKVEGKVQGLSLPKLVGPRDLSAGDLTLTLDNDGLNAQGTARLDGVPMAITWREDFNAGKKPSSRYFVSGILSDAEREKLGVSLDWRVRGPVGVKVDLLGKGGAIESGRAELTLDSTVIDYPELDLLRLPDSPGMATFDIAFAKDGAISLNNIQMKVGEVSGQGDVAFDKTGRMTGLKLAPIKIGDRTDLDLSITRQNAKDAGPKDAGKDQRLIYVVAGRKFDATGLLDWIGEPESLDQAQAPAVPYTVSAKVDKVVIADEAPPLRQVNVQVASDGSIVHNLTLNADVGAKGRLDLLIAPKDPQHRRLRLSSSDAGATLESALGLEGGAGGVLTVEGTYDDRTRNGPLTGLLEIKDLRVYNMPVLFQLLTLASIGGAVDTLQGSGILFGTSSIGFRSQDNRVYLSDGLLSGPMVALTLSGLVDTRNEALELKGAVVPLSSINSILGDLPLIGDLIVGRKGEGIIGVDYSITGSSSNPKISVNPLSMLAPGFLKRIFDIGDPKPPKN
jgi:hypothetical protein